MTRRVCRAVTGLLILIGLTGTAYAEEPEEGFQSLFNGKDLSGWLLPERPELFTVRDGIIVGKTEGDLVKNEFLVSAQRYGDFILKAKVRLIEGNSGIQFRSERAPDGSVSGPQADAAEGYWGLLYDERGRGILERYPEDKAKELVNEGDWNEYVITARGDHVVIELNGTTVIDRVDPEFPSEGVIGFQVHTGDPMEVHFKDIEIKPLD